MLERKGRWLVALAGLGLGMLAQWSASNPGRGPSLPTSSGRSIHAKGPGRGSPSARPLGKDDTKSMVGRPADPHEPAGQASGENSPDTPSGERLTERSEAFARAELLSEKDSAPDAEGCFERIKVLKTGFKYPFVRVVERRQGDRVLDRKEMVANQLIVRMRPGVKQEALSALNARFNARLRKKPIAPDTYVVILPAHDPDTLAQAVSSYSGEAKLLAYAEPDYIARIVGIPNDDRFNYLWNMHNTGQTAGTPDADIDAPEAWELATGNKAIKVGVIDTGIDYTHPDLAGNIWTNPGETGLDAQGRNKQSNGIDDDSNGFVDDWRGWNFVSDNNNAMDDHFHGTHVAGTIGAAGNNGIGVAGVCWSVSMVPLKGFDAQGVGANSDLIPAVYYATSLGVQLTSNSWGGDPYAQALKDAIDDADRHGILFVAAAGNDGVAAAIYPAAYASANILSVASTSHKDELALNSNYGSATVHLGAPGVDIYSTGWPNPYRTLSGTSMATPHVAGACALLESLQPGLTHAEVRKRILDTVDTLPSLTGKCSTGGRLNVNNALRSTLGPLVTMSAPAISDGTLDGASGNGNGVMNPGERIALNVTLRNVGVASATGVTAKLSLAQADASVTVVSGTLAAGNLAPQAEAVVKFLVDVSASASLHVVAFLLNTQDGAGRSWTGSMSFTVSAPYAIVDLGTLGGPEAVAYDVNNVGQVSGYSTTASGQQRAFRWTNGSMQELASGGGFFNYGLALNDNGRVAGCSSDASGNQRAVYWEGTLRNDLGTLGGSWAIATDANSRNQIVGYSATAAGKEEAFVWENGVLRGLGAYLPAWNYSRAWGINKYGHVVGSGYALTGQRCFLWKDAAMSEVSVAAVNAKINDLGQVAGSYRPDWLIERYRAFRWSNGQFEELQRYGLTNDWARGINNFGAVVGSWKTSSSSTGALLWDANGKAIDLNLYALPAGTGWKLVSAEAINDSGWIAGYGTMGGKYRGFLLKPAVAPNAPPVANSQSISSAEDAAKPLTLSATDPDHGPAALTYAIVTPPGHGTLSGIAPNITYMPALNYNGGDSFTFKANDGARDSNIATISITVTAVNDPPKLISSPTAVPNPAKTGQGVAFSVAGSDVDGDPLVYGWGFGDGTSGTGSAPTHAYASAGVFIATATVTDGKGGSASGSVAVTVMAADTVGPALGVTAVVLKGAVNDPSGVASLTVNDVATAVNEVGSWQKEVQLPLTSNTFTITATDTLGNATTRTVTITK